MLAQESPTMAKANTAISAMEMSPKEKWLYDSRMKYEHDRASCISEGYRQGIEEGIQQGLERGIDKGVYQKALETAKNFKRLGFDIAKIAEGTGLSVEEIERL